VNRMNKLQLTRISRALVNFSVKTGSYFLMVPTPVLIIVGPIAFECQLHKGTMIGYNRSQETLAISVEYLMDDSSRFEIYVNKYLTSGTWNVG
jgi:hypothetical protein